MLDQVQKIRFRLAGSCPQLPPASSTGLMLPTPMSINCLALPRHQILHAGLFFLPQVQQNHQITARNSALRLHRESSGSSIPVPSLFNT